jgi:hypothetical protein
MKLKAEFEEKQEELETAFAERAPNAKVTGLAPGKDEE